MSQPGLLTEAELPEHVNTFFDLKLEKDAFLKPTREVVTEIYTRFLLKLGIDVNRRSSDNEPESIPQARMIGYLKRAFSRYSIEYEFNPVDLALPTRKRTTAFINVSLFSCAEFEESSRKRQQEKDQVAEKLANLAEVKRAIAERREILEQLTFQKKTSKTEEEMELWIREIQNKLDQAQAKSEALNREKEDVKRSHEESLICKQEELKRLEDAKNKLSKRYEYKSLTEEFERLKRDNSEGSVQVETLNLELNTMKQRNQNEVEALKERINEIRLQRKILDDDTTAELDKYLRERDNRTKEREETQQEYNFHIEKFKKMVEDKRKKRLDSQQKLKPLTDTLITNRKKLETLIYGQVVESEQEPKDRTFVKSSQN